MGRYRVSGKARKMQIISLFRDVMFVCLTGVVWFRGDLGAKKAWIFIQKHGMFPSLQKTCHYTCPYLSFHPWSLNLFFGVFRVLNRLFLEVPWSFWKAIMFETAETNPFSSFETAVFWGRFEVVLSAASCWENAEAEQRNSMGETALDIAQRRRPEMDCFHLITGVMKGKPPQVRRRYPPWN